MSSEQRFDLHITCNFCGHDNHLTVATVSLPDCHVINCSVCGGAVGTFGEIRPRRDASRIEAVAGR
jgi:hypothetical protein